MKRNVRESLKHFRKFLDYITIRDKETGKTIPMTTDMKDCIYRRYKILKDFK